MFKPTKRHSARNRYFKAAALLLALVASFATALPSPSAASALALPDFSSEKRQLDPFSKDLIAFDAKVAELSKKATLTSAEINALSQIAEGLKRRTSQPQRAFRSIIDKLKAANQFNNFDDLILAQIRDERRKTSARTDGGPKRRLEAIVNDITKIGEELDADIQDLRAKLRAQSEELLRQPNAGRGNLRAIPVAYTTPAPAVFRKHPLRCSYWKMVNLFDDDNAPDDSLVKQQQHCGAS